MKGLTQKQFQVLHFIQHYIQTNHYSPSFREIMVHFGFSCVGSVTKHIEALKRKGLITNEKKCSRSLSLTETIPLPPSVNEKKEIELPLIGTLAAGYPIEMYSHSQSIAVPEALVHDPQKTYVIKAKGNGLQEEFILEGDLLIVEARQEAMPGETIIALINQHDTIIKQYYPEGLYVRLVGHNPQHHPLILREEDVIIQAVVISLMRIYK
jgi:repressor LexA